MRLPQRVQDFTLAITLTDCNQLLKATGMGFVATGAVIASAIMIIRMTGPYRYIGGALGIGGLGLGYDILINRMPQVLEVLIKREKKNTAFREVFKPSNKPKLQQDLVDNDFAKHAIEYIKKHPDWKTKSVQKLFDGIDPTITERLNQLANLFIKLYESIEDPKNNSFMIYCLVPAVENILNKMKNNQEPFIYPLMELVENLKERNSRVSEYISRYSNMKGTKAAHLTYDVEKTKKGWMDYSPIQWAFILSQPITTQFIYSVDVPEDFENDVIRIINNLKNSEQDHGTTKKINTTPLLTVLRHMFWLDEQIKALSTGRATVTDVLSLPSDPTDVIE